MFIAPEDISEILAALDWTQSDLARELDVKPSYISRLSRGERTPEVPFILRLLAVCRRKRVDRVTKRIERRIRKTFRL